MSLSSVHFWELATDDQAALLTETVAKVLVSQMDRAFRSIVLDLLLRLFAELEEPDFVSMCQCLIKLEKPDDVADILQRLVSNKGDSGVLLAYQIAFDLYENASQQFISKIEQSLIDNAPIDTPTTSGAIQPMEITIEGKNETNRNTSIIASQARSTGTTIANEEAEEGKNDEHSKNTSSTESFEEKEKQKNSPERTKSEDTVVGRVSETSSSSGTADGATKMMVMEASFPERSKIKDKVVCERLRSILCGEQTIKHHMQFLIKNNHTDMLILKQIKESVRTASAHNATVIANGLMHLGTTTDDFLRDNLEWISKATNWNKFNAVASLGLIHKGHEANALKLLDPYLPKGEADQFGFKEGGSLYAYGLIHANHGSTEVIAYLRDQLLKATTSAARHGACLGLGLAAMGTHDEQVFVQLRDCLYQDDAVTGEAAGLAMGLVMVGGMQTEAYQEMVQYVCDTQHDKIQRGLRAGIALLAYGRHEEAEKLIAPLLEHKSNAVLRSTAVCMLAMAYAGSGKADVVRRLLAKVAADPNQDVKRFAVIAIGFVLSNDAEQCLSYTGMLAEHFNPHVRYGAAMALGISCAGSGYKEAIALLDPLLNSKENFVRQGAVIALSFILIQQTDSICPKVNEFRRTLTKMITEKGEDSITKLGAILAQGIIDAGGRNVTISLHNRNGHPDMPSVVGTFVFLQYWYWHSLAHFSSLVFKPTCVIGLNLNLEMPKTEFRCNAKPSTFAYPPPLEEKKKEENEKVETAVLSVTHKKKPSVLDRSSATAVKEEAKVREEKTEKDKEEEMEVDIAPATAAVADSAAAVFTGTATNSEHKLAEPKSRESEATNYTLQNPARIVRLQLKTLQMTENNRYKPLKALSQGGIIMLRDRKAGQEKEEIVALAAAGGTRVEGKDSSEEAKPHTPFEINITSY
ncbi:26S proteasome non-ATPase regulatory subunit 1 [Loa loa]|uniref:26S proteasome non-ATPase regulatory subunit 1 n=1 Tax=Loa loa TaxID=7209 RepID=A0A1S0UGQ0_LOALO|nr:26S proteasome non-ATPase regulatory subunit 1 [Loa loa]EJD74769.1 26S proteasome non-ATPase regulatory subunit 1 [Loa loa]